MLVDDHLILFEGEGEFPKQVFGQVRDENQQPCIRLDENESSAAQNARINRV